MANVVPFGALLSFGAQSFGGTRSLPLGSINLETMADTAYLPTSATPVDVRGGLPGAYKQPQIVISNLVTSSLGGAAATSAIEGVISARLAAFQGTYLYGGVQVSGQTGLLVITGADGVAYGAWARISQVDLQLQPGQHHMHYLMPMTWTLLGDFAALPSVSAIPASTLANLHVPFGAALSYAGVPLGADGYPVQLTYQWDEQYRYGTGRYPVDMRGLSAAPLKTPTATLTTLVYATRGLYEGAAYADVQSKVNAILQGIAANPSGTLVVARAGGGTSSVQARITKPDLQLLPGASTHRVALPLACTLLGQFA